MGIGYILVSQTTRLWHLYVSYGLMGGIGSAIIYVPFVSTVNHWFKERRGTVLGILVAAIGVALMIVPPVVQVFISNLGWRRSYLVLGASLYIVTIASGALLKLPPNDILTQRPLVQDLKKLFVLMALLGIGYGGYVPLVPALIRETFGVNNVGSVLGPVILSASIGSSIGPVLGGYTPDTRGSYTGAFWLATTLTLLASLAASQVKSVPRMQPLFDE